MARDKRVVEAAARKAAPAKAKPAPEPEPAPEPAAATKRRFKHRAGFRPRQAMRKLARSTKTILRSEPTNALLNAAIVAAGGKGVSMNRNARVLARHALDNFLHELSMHARRSQQLVGRTTQFPSDVVTGLRVMGVPETVVRAVAMTPVAAEEL